MAEEHLTDGTTALAAQPRVIKIEVSEKPQNVRLRVAAYHGSFGHQRNAECLHPCAVR